MELINKIDLSKRELIFIVFILLLSSCLIFVLATNSQLHNKNQELKINLNSILNWTEEYLNQDINISNLNLTWQE